MTTVQELFVKISQSFRNNGVLYPEREAEDLLCELLELPRFQLYFNSSRKLTEQEKAAAYNWTERRIKGEPLAYLCGKISFYNCLLEINSSVLIPRPETEILVDKIVTSLKGRDLKGKVFWDICCGSGCIGIAVKKALPDLNVFLSDCSSKALLVAKKNADRNFVNIEFKEGDLLNPFRGQRAHYLACNPPYLALIEYQELEREVKDFEPKISLVGGQTGIEYYQRLAVELPDFLYSGSKVWLELGYIQGEAIKNLFTGSRWENCVLENDWAGHNRFLFLEIE